MKINKSVRRAACLLALSACAAMPALAKDSGFYVGASFGKAQYDLDESELSIFPIDSYSTHKNSDQAYSLSFGYRIMPYVGVELSLNEFGEWEGTQTGFLTANHSQGGYADGRLGTRGETLAVIGTLPLQKFELFAKAGAMRAETHASVRLATTFGTLPAPGNSIGTVESKNTAIMYGAGFGYTFGDAFFLKLEYTMVPKAAKESSDIGQDVDVSIATIGFQYRF